MLPTEAADSLKDAIHAHALEMGRRHVTFTDFTQERHAERFDARL